VDQVEILLDAAAYSADAIQRAAYKFVDRFSFTLEREEENFRCTICFLGEPDLEAVAAFRTEVLDEVLRERIRTETEGVRNLILSLAFSKTTLIEQ
jgi:His-Xaa-Ser system protein HxsD